METQWEYRTVLAVDIEKSSGRGNTALVRNRGTLRELLRTAFGRSGVDWEACAPSSSAPVGVSTRGCAARRPR